MKTFVILSALLAVTVASPFVDRYRANLPAAQRRVRRYNEEIEIAKNTKYGVQDGVPYLKHQVNLANSGGHTLDANAIISKDVYNNGPLRTGGGLDYAHKPSGAGFQLSGTHERSGGSRVEAAGVYNLYRNGGFGVDLKGGYSQQFGGPSGSGPPSYGIGINGGYKFGSKW